MDLRIVVIISDFQTRMETFVRRHISGLRSDVVAVNRDEADVYDWDYKPVVATLFRGRRSREFTRERLVQRLRESLFGIPSPKWPRGMETVFEKYVKERKPDVALAEFAPNGISAIDACERHGIPLVVHFHGYDASSLLRLRSYRKCLPKLFEKAAAIIVVSRLMQKTLERLGCPPEKISVIPCGAPVAEFQVSGSVGRQPCKVLAVSSLLPVKGIFYTLRAFAVCARKCPDTTLTIIGGGKQYGKAERWVRKNGLSARIHLLGYQPNERVRHHMAMSGMFVQHSVTSTIGFMSRSNIVEGWPVSIAEAAASGLPVIATRHGGIPDQVMDGETGFLVEERDWQAMAEKMIFLANYPERRKEMGLAGRRNVEEVGNNEKQIAKLRRVLLAAAK